MLKKLTLTLIIATAALLSAGLYTGSAAAAENASRSAPKQNDSDPRQDFSGWFVENEDSRWSEEDRRTVENVLKNTLQALDSIGLDGEELLDGYRFVRWAGEFAKDKDGKIALVNHADGEITLADTALLPENIFFIYHELGHIIDHRSDRALNERFHALALETGAEGLHEWTTAQGFFLRGQAHIKLTEATADAFALWIWVDFAGHDFPTFHDTPDNADPAAILDVFKAAILEALS